jgi:ankyrin repeat protein
MFFLWVIQSFLIPQALASYGSYYPSYPAYQNYSSYSRRQERSPLISMDLDPKHLLDASFRLAAREERLEDMFRMIKEGADVNSTSDEGQTALMYTSRNCSIQISRELLQLDANVNLTDKEGDSALIYATIESCVPVVKLLLMNPALDLFVRDHEGRTALDYASDAAVIEVGGPANIILSEVPRKGRDDLDLFGDRDFPAFFKRFLVLVVDDLSTHIPVRRILFSFERISSHSRPVRAQSTLADSPPTQDTGICGVLDIRHAFRDDRDTKRARSSRQLCVFK